MLSARVSGTRVGPILLRAGLSAETMLNGLLIKRRVWAVTVKVAERKGGVEEK